MIEIKDLTKKYDNKAVLENINIKIPDGRIYGLAGQSGVGKSTLLRCINGLESFDSGSICIDGTELNSLNEPEMREFRRSIGMIFQNFALLERKSVLENVMLPMEFWKYDRAQMEKKAKALLERVGLEEKLDSMPSELSGGQKQRVAIARALSLDPKILLCDEATSALDPAITLSILELIADINKELNLTVVMVTHEMSVIKSVCDDMAIIEAGHIVAEGKVEDVLLSDAEPVKKLIGERKITAPEGKALIKLVIRGKEEHPEAVCELARNSGIAFGIISAEIEPFHSGEYMGHMYLTVDPDKAETLAGKFIEYGIDASSGKEFYL